MLKEEKRLFKVRQHSIYAEAIIQTVCCQAKIENKKKPMSNMNSSRSGRPSSEVWKYEQKLDTWIQLADMLTARSELGLALIDGYLYACGGSNGEVRLNTIERYSITENKWATVSLSNEKSDENDSFCSDRDDASRHDESVVLFVKRFSLRDG